MKDYKKLQNGSDIRGIVLPTEDEQVNLDKNIAKDLAKAFVLWLSQKTEKDIPDLHIAIGHDSRITADMLTEASVDAMTEIGVKVSYTGLSSTPAMFMSCIFPEFSCDGSIMITASHLPFNRNGFKYFTKEGGLNKQDISEIIALAEKESFDEIPLFKGNPEDNWHNNDLMYAYASHLRNLIMTQVMADDYIHPLRGLKIMVDAGNGAGGFYAEKVLKPLGADISSSQYLEPDGNFPNHVPNPEDKLAMKMASDQLIKCGADFGLVFDTDVDRVAAIDKSGKTIARNGIVAIAAALIAVEHPGTTVVTDSITSDELKDYLENCLGLKHLRFKRGYRNVINKSIELNENGTDSQLAIETSGHGAYKENYFLDDGAYLATKIVIKAAQLAKQGQGIDCLIAPLKEPADAMEKRYPISCQDFSALGDKVLLEIKDWAQGIDGAELCEPNYEGVRINFNRDSLKGWCLLRKSLHDPILALNVECSVGSCQDILALIDGFLQRYGDIQV
ncbi:MAG: phosphomannomutase/phosphoglucomutase [Clostridia bacterium]|nr:phosphomannomutase/phosphoglucomutase [Clostridia bacterium]